MNKDKPWGKGMQITTVEKSYYRCLCPLCRVPFTVPEDLPEREEDFYGIDCLIAYCPICGQKLSFFNRRHANGVINPCFF